MSVTPQTWWVTLVALVGVAVSGAEATTRNVTAYRITPRNYTGLDNMNSGDAAGDVFFKLFELALPVSPSAGSA
jgi:hypothetical protein